MTAGRGLARAGLIVSATFLASRLLGWVRLVVIANTFPPGRELDSFFAAFRVPDLIFQLVAAGALGSALIPIVASLVAKHEERRAWRVVSTVMNLMLIALIALAVALFVLAPWVVPVITPGFGASQLDRTVELTRIMLLSPIFLAVGSVATSVLNAVHRFAAAAIAPIAYNLSIIVAALVLTPFLGIDGLAVGVVCGSLGHVLVQSWSVRRIGFRYASVIDTSDRQARTALRLMAPRAVGLGAGQITFVVITSLASLLGSGAITAYNVAFTLLQIPVGVIGVPLGTVVFPSLSREAALGNVTQYVSLVTRALRLLVYAMVPIAVLMAILARPVIEVLFPSFDPAAVSSTSSTLRLFLIGAPAHALIAVLARAFYARQDTFTPVAAAVLAVVINSTLAIILVRPLDVPGLALAIAIAAWVEAAVLVLLLARRLPGFGISGLVRAGIEVAVASAPAAAVAIGVTNAIVGVIGSSPGRLAMVAQGVAVALAYGIVFVVVSVALRIPELPTIVAVMADLLRRGAVRRS